MKIIPAKVEHLELLELRDQEDKTFSCDSYAAEKCKTLIEISHAGTLLKDGIVLAVMGYYELWPGVYEVWSMPSKHVPKHAITYLKTVKQYIQMIKETSKPHRIQSPAIADPLHDRWMSFLGMVKEGTMRCYTADKVDYNMWAIV